MFYDVGGIRWITTKHNNDGDNDDGNDDGMFEEVWYNTTLLTKDILYTSLNSIICKNTNKDEFKLIISGENGTMFYYAINIGTKNGFNVQDAITVENPLIDFEEIGPLHVYKTFYLMENRACVYLMRRHVVVYSKFQQGTLF